MKGVDFQASLNNLTQVDRLQQDAHKSPVVHQDQNAQMAQEEATQRIDMPVQPDQVEGKNIDPEGQRRNLKQRQKKKSKKNQNKKDRNRSGGSGLFVDLNA